jgi:hypothetical protein
VKYSVLKRTFELQKEDVRRSLNCVTMSLVLAFAKVYEVDGVCGIFCRRRRMSTEIWWENFKERDCLVNEEIAGRTVFLEILKK